MLPRNYAGFRLTEDKAKNQKIVNLTHPITGGRKLSKRAITHEPQALAARLHIRMKIPVNSVVEID